MSIRLTQQIVVQHRSGLNLRAAQRIAATAAHYASTISVVANERKVDAKKLLDLLTLAAERGTILDVEVIGDDAPDAMGDILSRFVDFDDEDNCVTGPGRESSESAGSLAN